MIAASVGVSSGSQDGCVGVCESMVGYTDPQTVSKIFVLWKTQKAPSDAMTHPGR
jgi:hypothetical protein